MTHAEKELLIKRQDDGTISLSSPDVGYFSAAAPAGSMLTAGMPAGVLHQLGKTTRLVVPDGAGGAITSTAPTKVMEPVGFRQTLYVLDPKAVGAAGDAAGAGAGGAGGGDGALTVKASQSGRVWHRPTPADPVFCAPGDTVEDGAALCLIEVMKTFSTVPYRAKGGLPARAKVVRWFVEDGGDVAAGEPLLEVEPG